ncbi:cytochrome c oxidase subunit IV-domain-containing protein [Roridomyces roridus]|uniref:Cytochrome c oxidase subunit IV-domain-containing protein n=1 Tax=Roridomyces roridus TaxID=1738132 RepID=A0AAD7C3N3_9AGAR|nr:cytochrome c oxidase subunit IV-domain-containing protein [Roridomyces roridus]
MSRLSMSLVRPLLNASRRRCLATATAGHVPASHSAAAEPKRALAAIPLGNIEAQWAILSPDEKNDVAEQLEEIQKRDWKSLSTDEKKAAYYVAFGPHGGRKPIHEKGDGFKIALGTAGAVGVAGLLFLLIRSASPPVPKTMSKEWQEAMNERAIEQKMNPITGIASEGYKGKGFVQ